MTDYRRGDAFAIEDLNSSDTECTASTETIGFTAFCNLKPGHAGNHVAAGADLVVVETWS